MKPIDPPDSHYLLAAEGWLDLGDASEAVLELERIAPELNSHPEVLKLRWRIYNKNKNWSSALTIARTICQLKPNHLFSRLHQSADLASFNQSPQMNDESKSIAARFPFFFAIPYNLACYACQLGNLQEAWDWLKVAMEMTDRDEIRTLALNDPDLEPLWHEISQI